MLGLLAALIAAACLVELLGNTAKLKAGQSVAKTNAGMPSIGMQIDLLPIQRLPSRP